MSDVDSTELKGGHAPAVKAGGMRVTQNKPPRDEVVAKDGGASAEESTEEQQVATKEKPSPVVVAGFETQGHKDFPAAAIKSFHDKPMPTHDKRPAHTPNKQVINQPRKQ
ncbi:hypothetical protein EB796_023066 [Bugula neritina]|uniref:DAP n=1 Tax=Bugula neritina TaxID=10212 RepID=A0A7J7IYW3_BUGNE|nr:hypothetical protein EB796_023066 [Bugula neritina]